jgi:hypothetical protein
VGLNNGTAISWDRNRSLVGADSPFDATNVTFVGFAIDVSSSGPIWAVMGNNYPTYLYTTTTELPSYAVIPSVNKRQMPTPLHLKLTGVWAKPYVSPLIPTGRPDRQGHDSAALVAMIVLTILFFFMFCVVLCVCLRNHRKRTEGHKYALAGVDSGVNPPHIRRWKPFRDFLRRLFCACGFCYNDLGYVHCCYYCLGGGSPLTDEARRKAQGEELKPFNQSNPAIYVVHDNEEEAQRAALNRPPATEPFSAPAGAAAAPMESVTF